MKEKEKGIDIRVVVNANSRNKHAIDNYNGNRNNAGGRGEGMNSSDEEDSADRQKDSKKKKRGSKKKKRENAEEMQMNQGAENGQKTRDREAQDSISSSSSAIKEKPAASVSEPKALVTDPIGNTFSPTSLYVVDLGPNVTDSDLYDRFSLVGSVGSVRVCRDLITRRSLGYGYVNYAYRQDASRAVTELNFTPLNNKPIRIMYSQPDPYLRRSGKGNIFIKNLDKAFDHKALFETFSPFGNILSYKVVTDGVSGESKGYGFVQFDNEESAQTAIHGLNGSLIKGKQVYVGRFLSKSEREKAKRSNVYVKNLSVSITDEDLKRTFGVFGAITSAVVMRDEDGKSKRFGFVNFENADAAAKAIEALNGKKVDDNKKWYVGIAQKKSERETGSHTKRFCNVYVKNLSELITDEGLNLIFGKYGAITSAIVMRDADGKSKGFGFVNFENPDDADEAIEALNGKPVDGGKEWYVGIAQKKSERELQQKAQFGQSFEKGGKKYLKGANLYINNLDETINDEKLRELFSIFGTIPSCKVMCWPSGISRRFGFVALSTPEEASRALAEMNGKFIFGKRLYVALAERKEERRTSLQALDAWPGHVAMASSVLPPSALTLYPPGASPQTRFGYQQEIASGMKHDGATNPKFFVPQVQEDRHQDQQTGWQGEAGPVQPSDQQRDHLKQQQKLPREFEYGYPPGPKIPHRVPTWVESH